MAECPTVLRMSAFGVLLCERALVVKVGGSEFLGWCSALHVQHYMCATDLVHENQENRTCRRQEQFAL